MGGGFIERAGGVRTLADLGELLRHLRRRHARQRQDSPLTYRELAGRTGLAPATISMYFTGRILPPTDRLDALAGLLGAAPMELGALATARDRIEEGRRGGVPTNGVAPAPRQLPVDIPGFAGRAAELARLEALAAGGGRAVVISAVSGMAGVGKTALAVHCAHRLADRYPDGLLYVNLRGFDPTGPPLDPAAAVRGFLDALGVAADRIPTEPAAQAALYRSLLAGKRVLAVLDNARDAQQVRPLLPASPGCLALVTSRNQLTSLVAAEGARPLVVEPLTAAEAGRLLAGRIGADRLAAEPEAVRAIVALTGRLPLALTIVAARAATHTGFPLASLAAELADRRHRLDALDGGEPTADLRAVFACSYRTLTPAAARLFRLLGRHPGPDLGTAAAASLAGLAAERVRPLLGELARAHLVEEPVPGRYSQHDLLRAYALDRVDDDAEGRAATHRLLDHYTHTAWRAVRRLDPHANVPALAAPQPGVAPEQPADSDQALAWFAAEYPVLLAAVDRARTEFAGHAWHLACGLEDYLDRRGDWLSLAAVGRTAVAAAGRLADPYAQAATHRLLAHAYSQLGRLDDAQDELGYALDLYRGIGDRAGQAEAERTATGVLCRRGRYRAALDHARHALTLAEAAGHRRGQAWSLNGIGWCHAHLGEYQPARAACRQAIALFQDLDDREGLAAAWDSLGYAHQRSGDHTGAVDCFGRAVALMRELGHRHFEAMILDHLGESHRATGDRSAARAAWLRALALIDDGDHPDAAPIRARLGALDAPDPYGARGAAGDDHTPLVGSESRS